MELTNDVLEIIQLLDSSTYNHSYRMWWLAREMETAFRRKDDSFSAASFIHDIGKYYIPYRILDKREGLTSLEREIIDLHPYLGYRLLEHTELPERVKRLVLYHHGMDPKVLTPLGEYDKALVEEDAKMLKTLDVFEAMTSDRPYKRRMSVEETYQFMKADGGFHEGAMKYLRENVTDF